MQKMKDNEYRFKLEKVTRNISETIKQKERQRRSLAALPFEKKIEMVFKLREPRKFVRQPSSWRYPHTDN